MPFFGLTVDARAPEEPATLMRRGMRWVLVGVGLSIMLAGVPLAILFHTPGVVVLAVGLVIVLRNSFGARRIFIKAQRRHPKIVFPIRRLIRREPEVFPVAWQASLRTERLITPGDLKRLRLLRRIRKSMMRRRR